MKIFISNVTNTRSNSRSLGNITLECVTFWIGQAVKARHDNQVIHPDLIWQPGKLKTKHKSLKIKAKKRK